MICKKCSKEMTNIQGSAYMCEPCGITQVVDPISVNRYGVGTRLAKKIPAWMPKPRGCNCSGQASWINDLGVSGAEEKFDLIVDHLVSQSSKTWMRHSPESLRRKTAAKWLRESIDEERANQ